MKSKLRGRTSSVVLHLALTIVGLLMAFPLLWMLRTSLMHIDQIFLLPPVFFPDPIQFSNYAETFRSYPFGTYMLNSLFISILFTAGAMFTSSLCAFGFSRIRWKGRDFVFTLILSSMILPSAVMIIPTYMIWNSIGVNGSYLPLILPGWLGGGAFYIFLLKQFFMSIPRAFDESAFLDGAGYFTIYSCIMLPLSKPPMMVVMLFAFLNSWNDFLNPLVYINDQVRYTVSVGLQLFMTGHVSAWSSLMATATVVILPGVVLFLIGQKFFVEGIVMSGIKG